jgi:hypothetical protein
MYKAIIIYILITFTTNCYSQEKQIGTTPLENKFKTQKKGKFYFYWGWNKAQYSYSDIRFKGDNYNFTLFDVAAQDRQTGWDPSVYLNPGNMTIPQTVARVGYYFHDNWNLSLGVDHMKYVMVRNQLATIDGYIDLQNSFTQFNGIYDNEQLMISQNFLQFEHTDGLNYINIEISRVDNLGEFFKWDSKKVQLNILESIGTGVLYPKTNSTLLSKERYDDFHFSGFGVSLKGGINLTLFDHFFIQAEIKSGYINMSDIRTTTSNADSASQDFLFFQRNISFGYIFQLIK